MTTPSRAPLVHLTAILAIALTAALAVVGAMPASAGVGSAPVVRTAAVQAKAVPAARTTQAKASTTTIRRVVLQWKGAPDKSRYTKSFPIPGIGTMTLTCQPNATRITLRATVRDRETQMWLAKYEDKSYGRAVAVKNVRIYRYAHASDNGDGGTGYNASEGLNQRGGTNGVENYGKGYAHGIISQREGRNDPVGDEPLRAVTTFNLNWYWNGFDYAAKYRTCKFDGTFVTKTTPRIGVNWHGEGDSIGNDYQSVRLPGLGYAELRCERGRYGRRTVTLVPDDDKAKAFVETIEGEGRVEDRVETRNLVTDPETGQIGPIGLPNNGMMRIFLNVDGAKTPFIVSSYQKINDPATYRNTCEVSMAQFPR